MLVLSGHCFRISLLQWAASSVWKLFAVNSHTLQPEGLCSVATCPVLIWFLKLREGWENIRDVGTELIGICLPAIGLGLTEQGECCKVGNIRELEMMEVRSPGHAGCDFQPLGALWKCRHLLKHSIQHCWTGSLHGIIACNTWVVLLDDHNSNFCLFIALLLLLRFNDCLF